ncbi:translation initiation factor IF-2 N-terminal domain-containing protein, partial [bacterium]|nr:translation initiation factor IF-2 N-terminal domain-containing protein [bacterium]
MKSVKMRVYEFAKQSNTSSKELVKILKEAGFEIGNHMSILDEKALNFLNKKLKDPSPKKVEKKEQIETMPSIQTQKTTKKTFTKKKKSSARTASNKAVKNRRGSSRGRSSY